MGIVIGIDPSLTKTGVSIITDIGLPWCTVIKSVPSHSYRRRLDTIYTGLMQIFGSMVGEVEVIGIERGFQGGAGPVAQKLGAANGMCHLAVEHEEFKCPVFEVMPKSRALYATGSGNADKQSVLNAARNTFFYRGTSEDEADALTIAYFTAEVMIAKKPTWEFVPFGGWPKLPDHSYDAVDAYCNQH